MKKINFVIAFFLLTFSMMAQTGTIPVAENLVAEGIPDLSTDLVSKVKNYTESRGASLAAWHPLKKEMLISTRFGNSDQLHSVKMPGGARKQITFFDEPISIASFDPIQGNYFLYSKDTGGNEFSQLYRFDLATKQSVLLTDGQKSQNLGVEWNNKGNLIAFASTMRNGTDRDIYMMDPLNPDSEKVVSENTGGGWAVVDWSPDDSKLLVQEVISINEVRLYLFDIKSQTKTSLLPEKEEYATFVGVAFTKDSKGIYVITNRENEFNRLAYYNFADKKLDFITSSIPWNVTNADLSEDGSQLAFVTNENGISKLYTLSTTSNQYVPIAGLPAGIISGIQWAADSKTLGMTFSSYNSSSDVYEYDSATQKIIRWTESELGGMDLTHLQEPELISWKSFDGKTISGYLYKASSKFTGKRPVMINIHGGPESQSRPNFLGRNNYYLNELGVSIIFPNVRGSAGYGKSFLDLDNGMKREDSVKDIGALLDWIAQQPTLDKDRIMVMGGSYGGYMSLAVSYLYPDKIRCSMDVVGISNFNTFMKNTESYRRDLRRVEYGDERDPQMAAFFESIAPFNHADKIKKPIFIIQGGNDPRVPLTESVQMKDKIKQNGGTVWYLMAKDEGHGFRKKNNQDFLFYASIQFITQYLIQ